MVSIYYQKMEFSDLDLLQRYSCEGSEDSFTELVGRHLNLVYSAALRQVGSRELAEEVAQSVFSDLARNANKLKPNTIVTAWLYRVTRCAAIDVVRRESRRQLREQKALEIAEIKSDSSEWHQIAPLLDEAMATLEEQDRGALLLRYFENKSLREVGEAMGTSENAAQKRLVRASERLRGFFLKRGVVIGSASITALLLSQAVQAAPVGMTAAISSVAVQKLGTVGVVKALTMTTMQKTLVATAITVAVGVTIYEATQVSQLKGKLQMVAGQKGAVDADLAQLQQERDEANRKLQSAQEELQRLRRVAADVPRLRGEVTRFNTAGGTASKMANDPEVQTALSWSTRVKMLKQRLEEMPERKIPELAMLTEQDWFVVASNWEGSLESDADFRLAFAGLRNTAKEQFDGMVTKALHDYAKANNGMLPADVSQLQRYFDKPLDKAVFDRYKMLEQGKLSDFAGDKPLVAETSYVDGEYDTHHEITASGRRISGVNKNTQLMDATVKAVEAFKQANKGKGPMSPRELVPYYSTPVDESMIQKFFSDSVAKGGQR